MKAPFPMRIARCLLGGTLALALAGSVGLTRGAPDVAQAHVAAAGSIVYAAGAGQGGFAGWTERDGTPLKGWNMAGGMLVSTGANGTTIIPPYQPGQHKIADYAVQAQIKLLGIMPGYPSYGLQARGSGGYGYFATYEADGHSGFPEIWNILGYTRLAAKFVIQFNPSAWHTYREEVVGHNIRFLIDGVLVLHGNNTQWTDGGVAGVYANATRVAVRSFTISSLNRLTPLPSATCGQCLSQTMLDWWAQARVAGWTIHGGTLVSDPVSAPPIGRDAEPGDEHLANYAVQAQVQVLKYDTCYQCATFSMRVHGVSDAGYDAVVLFKSPTVVSVTLPYLTDWKDLTIRPIGTHTFRMEVQGSSIRFFVDGSLRLQATDSHWKDGGYVYISASHTQLVVQRYTVAAL